MASSVSYILKKFLEEAEAPPLENPSDQQVKVEPSETNRSIDCVQNKTEIPYKAKLLNTGLSSIQTQSMNFTTFKNLSKSKFNTLNSQSSFNQVCKEDHFPINSIQNLNYENSCQETVNIVEDFFNQVMEERRDQNQFNRK